MELNKLFLFAKNTDAFASQRGYNYQTLKTLETWISNFIEGVKEDIYCEFEEDIFQKDILTQKLKFRQIKLYSSNFSFSSEEIKKCICHFFILHIKDDYRNFSKEYVFETNSNVAQTYPGNNAEMLKEWFEHQDKLDEEKLRKYTGKVKDIVTEYIEEQKKALKDRGELNEAVEIFDQLDGQFWEGFTKTIKWEFIGTSPDHQFSSTRENIDLMIKQLPYETAEKNPTQVFGVLLDAAFNAINKSEGQERKLSYDQLEKCLLEMGGDNDKRYSNRYDYYKTLEPLTEFRIGEFYEIIDLANYCRRKKYLLKHKEVWNQFLIYYAREKNIEPIFRRKSIYELVFLNNEFYEVDYENLALRERPNGSLLGFEEDIQYYFSDFTIFQTSIDIENANNIINVVFVASQSGQVHIEVNELKMWFVKLYRIICQKLLKVEDVSEKCSLLEQRGNFLMGINRLRENSNIEFIQYYEEILALAEQAPLYKLSQFGDRIEKYIKMQLNIDPEDSMGIIEALEDFSEKLFPLVEKREGKIALAQSQVRRGYSYLKTSIPKNLLKALDYFHKAKDNYQQEDTIEGFVLALLNIAQLYNSIGMHFAAKNYALAAFRMSTNKELLKRTETSLAMLGYSDYKQGSWFNALSVYGKFINLRLETNYVKSEAEDEQRAIFNIAFMLYVMGRSSYQFNYLIKNYIIYLDYVGDEIILPIQSKLNEQFKSEQSYYKAIKKQIDDFPLNDFGKTRIINFYALGSLWRISFDNNHNVRSVAEEYISTIQIVLAEISLCNIDFHLLKSTIEIELTLNGTYREPEQIASNDIIKWKVYICYSDAVGIENINRHSVFNMVSLILILDNISVLPSQEFKELYWEFFEESKLDSKQTAVNLYQKIHRDVYSEKDYKSFYAESFNKEGFEIDFPNENKVMEWNSSLSSKYDQAFSLEAIKNRFNNLYKSTSITLSEIMKDEGFPEWIDNLRNQGYKDWLILMNVQNFMLNYKTRRLEVKEFNSEEEHREHFQKSFLKYSKMDEKDCYIKFPLKAFQTKEFTDQFDISIISVLNTYGLESKLMTPNFVAVKEFLNVRFNLDKDDYSENNPFLK